MSDKFIVIQPEYVSKFQCDGNLCNAQCCKNWNVIIDNTTYSKYKSLKNKYFAKKICSTIEFSKKWGYLLIKLDRGAKCPHLRDDNLCSIQRKLGMDYLSEVCATYPRYQRKINDGIEQSLDLSCPLAAKLALLDDSPMAFEQVSLSSDYFHESFIKTNKQKFPTNTTFGAYIIDMQMFIIPLLQNRALCLEDRLILLGFFLDQADQLAEKNQPENLPLLIQVYNEMFYSQQYGLLLSTVPENSHDKVKYIFALLDKFHTQGLTHFIADNLDIIKQEFHLVNEENDLSILVKFYHDAQDNFTKHFLTRFDYILENYIVNEAFRKLFPLTIQGDLKKNYIVFINFFVLFKFFCMGLAAHHKENLSSDHILELVQNFSRAANLQIFLDEFEKQPDLRQYMSIYLKSHTC